jgi:hypothetical protein
MTQHAILLGPKILWHLPSFCWRHADLQLCADQLSIRVSRHTNTTDVSEHSTNYEERSTFASMLHCLHIHSKRHSYAGSGCMRHSRLSAGELAAAVQSTLQDTGAACIASPAKMCEPLLITLLPRIIQVSGRFEGYLSHSI